MRVLFSWLKEWLPLEGRTAMEIAADLESIGHEVETIRKVPIDNVFVGQILSIDKHPRADKLSVARVSLGPEREIQLIFGQYFPVAVGDKLPVAVAPCLLPTGINIQRRKIRGIESEGMLAADGELGRSFTKEGILRFSDDVDPGTPLTSIIEWDEAVFDIAITPNRGDVLSLRGLARDLAARYSIGLTEPSSEVQLSLERKLQVQVTARDACPRYSVRLVENIHVDRAPSVLSGRLGLIGHGIYNSVVDITNFVMEEFGVPLHAFDADRVSSPIIVRFAQPQETIELLDGSKRDLVPTDLVIADQVGPIALAGIMGGMRARVTEQTQKIILEAAYFDPISIRKTARRLHISTDASYRFERGTDPMALERASDRAARLLGSNVQVGQIVVVGDFAQKRFYSFQSAKIASRLGVDIPEDEQKRILKDLGFEFKEDRVIIPPWRSDIQSPDDLSEEIGRIYGYERFPRTLLQPNHLLFVLPDDRVFDEREWLKDFLANHGWTEHIGSSFVTEKEAEEYGLIDRGAIRLFNPVSTEAAYLRPNLIISLAMALTKNPVFRQLQLFELGSVFIDGEDKLALGLLWTDDSLVGEKFLKSLPITTTNSFEFSEDMIQKILNDKEKRRSARFHTGLIDIGRLAEMARDKKPRTNPNFLRKVHQPSRFQPVMRDIAILVSQTLQPDQIIRVIKEQEVITDVELFDQFTSAELGNSQSLAFHVLLERPDRTLTREEIQETMTKIEQRLRKEFKAKVR